MKNIKEKISIIMPAYNEASRIGDSIKETAKTFNEFGCVWELIVIDDGSNDGTQEKAESFLKDYAGHLIIKKNNFNRGKGRAIKKALHYCSGDYIVWLDADMELHPLQVQTLFDIMRLDNVDIVIGSKTHPNSIVNYPFYRRVMSLVYYLFVRSLFNLPCHDTQTGLKLFKAEVLRKVFPRILVKKFAFDLEVLVNAHHLGYSLAEAPIVINHQGRYGRIGLKAIWATLLDTLAIFYRMHILRYYDRIGFYRHRDLYKEFRKMRR